MAQHSAARRTWRAPPMAPARELAVDRPRSFWQWVEMITLSAPGVLALILAIRLYMGAA